MAKLIVPSDSRTLARSEPSHAEMHHEHLQWQSEANLWRDDLRVWEKETHDILEKQAGIKEAFEKHLAALQTHAAAIRLYEQQVKEHEHALAEFEQGGPGEQLIQLAKKHQQSAERHAKQHNSHQVIKKLHRTAVSRWSSLAKSLQGAAKQDKPIPSQAPQNE